MLKKTRTINKGNKLCIFITQEKEGNWTSTTMDFVGDYKLYDYFKREALKECLEEEIRKS